MSRIKTIALIESELETMSSIEIADLCNKEHKHIIRDIKSQILKGLYEIDGPKMDAIDGPNLDHQQIQGLTIIYDDRKYIKEILLDRFHTDVLMAGYSVKYRAAIIRRRDELEKEVVYLRNDILNRQRAELDKQQSDIEQQYIENQKRMYSDFDISYIYAEDD